MTDVGNSSSPWQSVKLGLLMFAISLLCLSAAILAAFRVIFPAIGIDPSEGVTLLAEPVRAALLIGCVLLAATVVSYGGVILGAWIARRHFPLLEVESEFLRLLWLPGTRAANTRLFRYLFSRSADV